MANDSIEDGMGDDWAAAMAEQADQDEKATKANPVQFEEFNGNAAAATMPTCRSAPPKILRARRARAISSAGPTRIEPIGHPSPFEKQRETVSK